MIRIVHVEDSIPRKGKRFLIERSWPRGADREALALDGWFKEAAPTYDLLRWYRGKLERYIDSGTRPSLIHGDVWGGNVLARGGRIAAFVDPAIYFADAEIELAFSTLFGTFGEAFFDRYRQIRPIAPGFFEVRRDLYNLYPLLVHTRLFGASYAASVKRSLARFV